MPFRYYSNRPLQPLDLPSRTPGPLGMNDQADPNIRTRLGITPGPLGRNDDADPNADTSLTYLIGISKSRSRVCYAIPEPRSLTPPLLTDSDFETAARTYDIEASAIFAVSEVESGGRTGFDRKGRPKILFEAKWFHHFTAGRYDYSHPHLSQPTWEGARRYYGTGQWRRLVEAFSMAPESALKSASWGKFQIMGFNHSGFRDVFGFCDAMFHSERKYLMSFLAYCEDHHLIQCLKKLDWARFAKVYNGAAYRQNQYDVKLQSAYYQYEKRMQLHR